MQQRGGRAPSKHVASWAYNSELQVLSYILNPNLPPLFHGMRSVPDVDVSWDGHINLGRDRTSALEGKSFANFA